MSTSTLVSPAVPGRSWTTALRIALAAVMIVLLTALAFAVGRATVGTRTRLVTPAPVSIPGAGAFGSPDCPQRNVC
jgi:hypothetical protein